MRHPSSWLLLSVIGVASVAVPPSLASAAQDEPSVIDVLRNRDLSPILKTEEAVEQVLHQARSAIDNKLFLYQNPTMQWEPSSVYRYDGFLAGLRVMYTDGVANKQYYMGDSSTNGPLYGLVNIAAFLAQSMKETIKYDACDENSWDLVNGRYPLSNACGQLGQSYQDYKCKPEEAHMECAVDPTLEITAVTNAKWYGAPGPLKCGPKTTYPRTGYWDYSYECNKPWATPAETCDAYEGQKAGGENNATPFGNYNGRTDVEGCCYWGRGVIQTTGICNFGKLNYYLGKRAADEGRQARYPNIDFCADPEAICASQEHQELKWIAGFFYWVESVQTYDEGGWNYLTKLHDFVDGGMTDNSFIDSVSGIVNRGCHNPPCGTGKLDGGAERKGNFKKVLDVLGLKGGGSLAGVLVGSGAGNSPLFAQSYTGPVPTAPAPTVPTNLPPPPPPTVPAPVPTQPQPQPTAPKPTFPSSSSSYYSTEVISRCGVDWIDANCGQACASDADCMLGLQCWATIGCDDRRRRGLRG